MTDYPTKPQSRGIRPAVMMGLLALLAPAAYLTGRLSSDQLTGFASQAMSNGLVPAGLGAMIGIPVGLFFGSLRRGGSDTVRSTPNTRQMERSILEQLRAELAENHALFDARKGSTTMFARIDYINPFWSSIKASGRLFVMQNAQLLGSIATAYYWLDQATHLEKLAYEAKYAPQGSSDQAAERLIGEARLLDGQIESSLETAIAGIDQALAGR